VSGKGLRTAAPTAIHHDRRQIFVRNLAICGICIIGKIVRPSCPIPSRIARAIGHHSSYAPGFYIGVRLGKPQSSRKPGTGRTCPANSLPETLGAP